MSSSTNPKKIDLEIPGYRIDKFIGRGGSAEVYLALQQSLNRYVALKVVKKFERPAQVVRFFNEGQIVASMNHPNIITIYDIGSIGNRQYIAMEYLEGGSLRDRIKEIRSSRVALRIIRDIASALEQVHQQGIVHRDIKPENILFHKSGIPKITDFGVAKVVDGEDMNLTMDGTALGSPYYLSPEQAQGHKLDGRSDIYSLGVVLYEMLAGKRPYSGNTAMEVILAHMSKPVPKLPPRYQYYQSLIDMMMAKSPDDRFASIRELIDYLDQLPDHPPRSEPSHIQSEKKAALPKSKSSLRIGLLGILAALLAFIAYHYRDHLIQNLSAWSEQDPMAQPMVLSHQEQPSEPIKEPTVTVEETILTEPSMEELNHSEAITTEEVIEPPTPIIEEEVIPFDSVLLNDLHSAQAMAEPDFNQAIESLKPVELNLPAEDILATDPLLIEEPLVIEEPANETSAADDKKQIEQLLAAAEQALKKYRLTSPKGDNAYEYYQKVLAIDPQSQQAKKGIQAIVDKYIALFDRKIDQKELDKAETYLNRALKIQPNNPDLVLRKEQLLQLRAAEQHASIQMENQPPPLKPVSSEPVKEHNIDHGIRLLDSLE